MTEWQEWKKQFQESNKCLFPEREGPHKVACCEPATTRSKDRLPACKRHRNFNMKKEWRGYFEGNV